MGQWPFHKRIITAPLEMAILAIPLEHISLSAEGQSARLHANGHLGQTNQSPAAALPMMDKQ